MKVKTFWLMICTLILALATMTSALGALNDSIVSYWNFDGDALDSVSSYNGVIVDATQNSSGFINQAYYFDGGNDNDISLGDMSGEFASNKASINMWVKLVDAVPAADNGIMMFSNSASGNHYPFTDGDAYLTTFRNVRIDSIPLSGSVDRTQWHMLTITTENGVNNWKLYQNGVQQYQTTGLSSIYVGAVSYFGSVGTTTTINGMMDEIGIWDKVLTPTEITQLYNAGSGLPYPFTGALNVTINNFSTISTGSFSFNNPITISNSFGVVNSITMNSDNDEVPFYFASTFTTNATGSTISLCRITIDGTSIVTGTRSLDSNTLGNFKLITPSINLSLGNHTVNTECRKSGGSNYQVSDSQMTEFHLLDEHLNQSVNFLTINSTAVLPVNTTDSLLSSFSFTTGNTTNTTNLNNLVVHGRTSYNYDNNADITTYLKIQENGETCANYTRGGLSGDVGSVGTACAFTNLNSSTTYNLSFYGSTSSGTGSISDLIINIYELETNESAISDTKLSKIIPNNTLTLVDSINISNILGGSYNVFVDAGFTVNASTSQDAYFYLKNTINSISYYRTIDSLKGAVNTQFTFSESGIGINTYELYAFCPEGCEIVSGDLVGFVTDAESVSTGEFFLKAFNVYNNTQIMTFNATVGGSTFSTTNGTIEIIASGNVSLLVEANNFFSNTSTHDTTTDLNVTLASYVEIRGEEYLTGNNINIFTVNMSGVNYSTTNGIAYLPVVNNNTSVTFQSSGTASQTDFINQTHTYTFTVYAENSLRINIYNGTTNNLLTQTVNINTISNLTSFTNSTTNGTTYITLLFPNSYELRFDSNGFSSQSIFLTVNSDSTQEINIYMIENTTTEIQRVLVTSLEGSAIEGAIVRLQIQTSDEESIFYTINERTTNSEGITAFYVERSFNVYYRFIVIYQDEVKLTTVETFFIPNIDEIITLEIDTSSVSGVDIEGLGLVTNLIASGSDNETYTFSWVDADNDIVGGRLVVTTQDLNFTTFSPDILFNSNITMGATGSISYSLPVVNNTKFIVKGYIIYNSFESLEKERPVIFGETISIERNSSLLLASLVFITIVLLTLSLGPLFSGLMGFVVLLVLTLLQLVTIPLAILTSFMAFLFIVFIKIKGGGNQ